MRFRCDEYLGNEVPTSFDRGYREIAGFIPSAPYPDNIRRKIEDVKALLGKLELCDLDIPLYVRPCHVKIRMRRGLSTASRAGTQITTNQLLDG